MDIKYILTRLVSLGLMLSPVTVIPVVSSAPVSLPPGFDEVFNSELTGILDLVVADVHLGTYAITYDMGNVTLKEPSVVADRISSGIVPNLTVTASQLHSALAKPIPRVNKLGFPQEGITAYINENEAKAILIFPKSYLAMKSEGAQGSDFIDYQHRPGFVHSQNLNYFNDSYGSNFNLMSNDTLSLTGNSYFNSAMSVSKDASMIFDEAAFYLEDERTRYKIGRQNITSNMTTSTPSMFYSFMNSVNFDGVSLGYLSDYYRSRANGASSPINIYMPSAGTVEIYRAGRLLDMQQLSGGLQPVNTERWPAGGYDITIVSKLNNGSEERKTQPFFKRYGDFSPGKIEYLMQMGKYDGSIKGDINQCGNGNCQQDGKANGVNDNGFASAAISYTTENALSLGSGVISDNGLTVANASIDMPINSLFLERIYTDGIYGKSGSYGYSIAGIKSYDSTSLNVTYRNSVFNGDISEYGRNGIIPAYDNEYLQLSMRTYLPFQLGFGIDYSYSTSFSSGGRKNKGQQNTLDILLNRDFQLSSDINLRVDAGYHTGKDVYDNAEESRDHQLYTQFTLGFTDSRYNHYQSLYLKARNSDKDGDDGIYSADYAMTVNNPEFDRGGRYNFNFSASDEVGVNKNASGSLTVNNRFGYTSFGNSQTFNDSKYRQSFVTQRSGFSIGDGTIAYGAITEQSALVIDATKLPTDEYFEVRNYNSSSVIVPGGKVTSTSVRPYTQIDTSAEQVYTGSENNFYNVTAKNESTHVLPGQTYKVILNAVKNQTVTGRIYYARKPLANARIVGSNGISDESGFFVGDFLMNSDEKLEQLKVRASEQEFVCKIDQSKTKSLQGVIQLNGVECEHI
ncbi:TcfC E-set like domain-containing protein [Budvicia diplopodorum]|uniref:TcfC E-set like domain-containing protein n=1 Tax=Budvicia diplopodorum TaxID=1119056 RepID=UPI0013598A8B|nr:TcfC E-set like domain-containing protein [Budvicia diplopodorum]